MSLSKEMMIHVAVELVLFVCLSYYTMSQTKKINARLDEIMTHLQTQAQIVQNHENMLGGMLKKAPTVAIPQTTVVSPPVQPKAPSRKKKVKEPEPEVVDTELEEENLDEELREELEELEDD